MIVPAAQLFAEDAETLSSGIFALGFELEFETDLNAPPPFVEFIRPFQLTCGDVETAFSIATLSPNDSPLGMYWVAHGHLQGEKLAELRLVVRRKPPDPPPEWIVRSNEAAKKIGGFPHLMNLLCGQRGMCKAEIQIVVTKKFRPRLLLKKRRRIRIGPFSLSDEQLELKTTGEGEDTPLELTAVFPEQYGALLIAKKKISVELQEGVRDALAETFLQQISPLFEPE